MDNPDQRSGVEYLVKVLRKVTRAVRLAPFVYLVFYGLFLICEFWIPELMVSIIDKLFYIQPTTIATLLMSSSLLKMCHWHKIACLIPGATQVADYIDSFFFQFTQCEIIHINASVGILSLAFLIIACKQVFYGRK